MTDAAAPAPTCATGADLVYVASEERNLYAFDPAKLSFTLLGNIDCAQGVYVNSMAIDRNATACNQLRRRLAVEGRHAAPRVHVDWLPADQQGVSLFGMGFAAKTAGGTDDLLFIDDLSGGGLGFIDQSTMTLNRLGPLTGALTNQDCELTGTSNASLFGFFAGGPLSSDGGAAAVVALIPPRRRRSRSGR